MKEHVISEELWDEAQAAFSKNKFWIACNSHCYFMEKGNTFFFNAPEEAKQFASEQLDKDQIYKVIYARSLSEMLKQIPYGEVTEKQLFNIKNLSIMNEKNFEYLKDNIKYHGFGETLNAELEKQLSKGTEEFSLPYKTEINKRNLEATLHFRKSDSTDMYFFNKYDVRATTERNNEPVAQTFYLNKSQGVTLKEAYNLLNGRAVHKELIDKQDQKYHAWIQLDFSAKDKNGNYERKQFHQNYGYDLKETLGHYPVKEMMKEEDKGKLIRSLEKGNVQMVTMETTDRDVKIFIEANPQYKTLNLYNIKMESLDQEKRKELMQKPEMTEQAKDKGMEKDLKQDAKKTVKQISGDDGEPVKKKTNRKRGMSI